MVEREYDAPFDKKNWLAADQKLLPCLEIEGAKWMRSQVSLDGQRVICEFEAPDAELIRSAFRRTSIGFERVWVAEVLDPSQDLGAWAEKFRDS
ncbi:DUF4242 domain-containing protein [Phormidium tenue FACHB-886]|nr:DUF4242 domain-containing protein [Phormidium tenue FACHB-886]